jgi:hypothetical protein
MAYCLAAVELNTVRDLPHFDALRGFPTNVVIFVVQEMAHLPNAPDYPSDMNRRFRTSTFEYIEPHIQEAIVGAKWSDTKMATLPQTVQDAHTMLHLMVSIAKRNWRMSPWNYSAS